MASAPPLASPNARRNTLPAANPFAPASVVFKRDLIRAVDGVPQTRGLGVVLVDFGRLTHLRRPSPGDATVVFERCVRPVRTPPLLAKSATAPRRAQPRTPQTSPATEWMNLGFNCGGAVLAWVGIAGMGALAPVTGGLSLPGAALLYAGAAASTGQCVVSVVRTANAHRGRADINAGWDASPLYVNTMRAADGISLIGAGGALKELRATNAVLHEAGFSLKRGVRSEAISRPMRKRLTTMMGLEGGKRVPGAEINRVVRQRLLDGVGGAVGLFASGYSGLLNEGGNGFWDVVVWITEETGQRS